MNFNVDKENNRIIVEREFAAPVSKVWKAWTNPEIIDKWWAPKPWKAVTQSMNFTEGGTWLYYMEGPDGTRHYCKADYIEIEKGKKYSGLDAFCDKDGNINTEFPRTKWHVSFHEKGNNTLVIIENHFEKLEDLEAIIKLGFKEGFTMALENLDEIFGG